MEAIQWVTKKYEIYSNTYKLVIMDLKMPTCDGFKARELIIKYFNKVFQENGSDQEAPLRPFFCALTSDTSEATR